MHCLGEVAHTLGEGTTSMYFLYQGKCVGSASDMRGVGVGEVEGSLL